jgi:hypothetical protein
MNDLSILCLNLDGSNRKDSVSSSETLGRSIVDLACSTDEQDDRTKKYDLISMCEVTNPNNWIDGFEATTGYLGVFVASYQLYAAFNPDRFDLIEILVFPTSLHHGLMLLLRDKTTTTVTLHISVHCPRSNMKWTRTMDFICMLCQKFRKLAQLIMIAGDFNARPEAILPKIPTYNFAIPQTIAASTSTTQKNNCIDNVLVSKGSFNQVQVDEDCPHFTHHPLSSIITFK